LPSDSSGGVATKAKMRKVKKSAAEFLFPLEMLEISGNKNSRLASERSRELRTEKQRHPASDLNPFVAELRWVDPKENISTIHKHGPGKDLKFKARYISTIVCSIYNYYIIQYDMMLKNS